MPSGAKKRKAAKKKKEDQPNNESKGSSVHGDEDVKVEEDISSAEGSRNNYDGEKIVVVEEGVVQVERDFKKDDGRIEDFEAEGMKKKSYSGGGSCSSQSSTSSDDENDRLDKSKDTEPVNSSIVENVDLGTVSQQISSTADPCVASTSSIDNTATSYDPKKPQNGAGHGITEPLLVPPSRPVQKTSWTSCCGLLDVFSGSGS